MSRVHPLLYAMAVAAGLWVALLVVALWMGWF